MTKRQSILLASVTLLTLSAALVAVLHSGRIPKLGFDAFRKTDSGLAQTEKLSEQKKQSTHTPGGAADGRSSTSNWIDDVQANYRASCGVINEVDHDLSDVQVTIARLSDEIKEALRRQETIAPETFDRLNLAEREESRLSMIQTLCAADQLRAHLSKQKVHTNIKETTNEHEG